LQVRQGGLIDPRFFGLDAGPLRRAGHPPADEIFDAILRRRLFVLTGLFAIAAELGG
jgi:hypothetical protein